MRFTQLGLLLTLGMVTLGLCGCAGPQGGTPTPSSPSVSESEPLFDPIPLPPDFDRERAMLTLEEIPGDPPAPGVATTRPADLPRAATRYLEEARRLFTEHRYTETILQLEKALNYDPDNAVCHQLMSVACLLSGNDARARRSAEKALELDPASLTCHYVLARIADKAGDEEEAIRGYRTALKCERTEANATYRVLTHYCLGTLLDEAGYTTAAIEQYRAFDEGLASLGDAADTNPELATIKRVHRGPAALRMARGHGLLGQYGKAADALATAIAHTPDDVDLRTERIRMLVRAERLEEATWDARTLVQDTGSRPEVVELLLAVYRHAGRFDDGMAALRDILAEAPDNVELWVLYAETLAESGQHAEAADVLQELIDRHPGASQARWKLITTHRSADNWPAWLGALARTVADKPAEYIRAGQELERIADSVARSIVQEAVSSGDEPKKFTPPEPKEPTEAAALDYLFGRLCDRLNRLEDARLFFERAVHREKRFLPGTIGLAELYVGRCRWSEAIAVLDAASGPDREPSHEIERLLGQCREGLDQMDKAVEHYERAIELNPVDVRTLLLLADLHERNGERREARDRYRAAVAAAPDNLLAREAYVRDMLTTASDVNAMVGRVSLEFSEMQKRDPTAPPTVRCEALLTFLQDRDRDTYCQKLRELIRSHPDDLRTRLELAATLFTFRDYEEARLEVTELLERDPYSARGGELLATTLMKLLRYERAAREFDRILELYPNRRPWIARLAELHMLRPDYDEAIKRWKQLISLQPEKELEVAYRGHLMQAYRQAGRFDQARELAEEWLNEPDASEAARESARWFLLAADEAEGKLDRYVERCLAWLENNPRDRTLRAWLIGVSESAPPGTQGRFRDAGGLIGAGRHHEAAVRTIEWLMEDPSEPEMIEWLGEGVLGSARRFDETIELMESLTHSSSRFFYLQHLQWHYLRAQRDDEAVEASREMLTLLLKSRQEIDPDQRDLIDGAIWKQRRGIAVILSQTGRFDEALTHLEQMLERADGDAAKADLLKTMALVHQRQQRMDLAERRLREALELTPSDVGLNNDLGYTLADAGKDIEEAEQMIRLAVGEAPHQAAYLDSLGWVLYKKGDFAGARAWLERAIARPDGQDQVIHDHLGDVYWQVGEKDRAVKSWRRGIEVYETRLADGETDADTEFVERLRGKLNAVADGREPALAPVVEP